MKNISMRAIVSVVIIIALYISTGQQVIRYNRLINGIISGASNTNTGTITGGTYTNATITGNGNITTTGSITRTGVNTTDSQLKIGNLEFQSYATGLSWIGDNVYLNGTAFKYRSTGTAGMLYFNGSEGQFRFSTSGTAGADIPNFASANSQLKINADGNVAFGSTVNNAPSNYTGATFRIDPSGNTTQLGNAKMGVVAVTGTTTPNNIDLGGTYSTVAGANPKLLLFSEFGFGVSAGQLDYMSSAGAAHTFYAATTKLLSINTAGATFTVPVVTTQYKLSALNTAPASAAAAGTTGEIRWTNGFVYICVATNTWQRSALTTW